MGKSMAAVVPLGSNDSIAGNISTPGEVDEFEVTLTDSGRLTAEVQTGPGLHLGGQASTIGEGDLEFIHFAGSTDIPGDAIVASKRHDRRHALAHSQQGPVFEQLDAQRTGPQPPGAAARCESRKPGSKRHGDNPWSISPKRERGFLLFLVGY